jgi:hypothetical protein
LVCVIETHCEIGIEFSNTIVVKLRPHRSQNFMKLSLLLEAMNCWVLLMDLRGGGCPQMEYMLVSIYLNVT